MKDEVLKQALRQITKVFVDPRLKPGQRDQLQKAKRELEKSLQSGKLDERRLFRAVAIVSAVLLEIVQDDATRR
jgi:uncharacterized protein